MLRTKKSSGDTERSSSSGTGETTGIYSKMPVDPQAVMAGMQVAEQGVGLLDKLFGGGRNQRANEEAQRLHEEKMKKLKEDGERINKANAARQAEDLQAKLDLEREKQEWEDRKQDLSRQKDEDRKEEAKRIQEEKEFYDKKVREAQETNQRLMEVSREAMDADKQNFLATKRHMENSHQMEVQMIKGIGAATANLYRDLGYFDRPGGNGRNQGALLELEGEPTSQQIDYTQPGEGPSQASSGAQIPECLYCDKPCKLFPCQHYNCKPCQLKTGRLQCTICKVEF